MDNDGNKDEETPVLDGRDEPVPETALHEPGPPSAEELAELRKKAEECDGLVERLKRVTADYLNSQKRLQRQTEERVAYAIEEFARELLVVSDDLQRGIAATGEHQTVEAILEGLSIVDGHLQSVLERHGVTPVETRVGCAFDPEIHEAMAVVETDECEPNRVVEEIQRGFLIHKRLLRPSRVVVSAEPKTEPDDSET